MNKLYIIILLIVFVGVNSCKTDIDVNADYEDITVVYGLINPLDSIHYIKINKAFLGNPSVIDAAANSDNFNYADGDLDVQILEYDNNGNLKTTVPLVRTVNEVPKDAGIFDNSTNVLYKYVNPTINRDFIYKLNIYNNLLDKEITAETDIVNNVNITKTKNSKFAFWIGTPSNGNSNSQTITVTTGAGIGRVNAKLIFNYIEHYTIASNKDSVLKSIEMPLGEKIISNTTDGESVEWVLKGETFFQKIESNITPNVPYLSHREIQNISMEFLIAGTELNTFMLVSAPSNNVNQDKPSYTNINNGLGIFSSREKIIWESTIDPNNGMGNVNLTDYTIGYLQSLGLDFCFGVPTPTSNYECNQQ